MTPPSSERLFAALDATWPPGDFLSHGPWTLRRGLGGGQRVSAATATGPVRDSDINRAAIGMRDMNQSSLFMIRPGDDDVDRWLDARGYDIVDPVVLYLCNVDDLCQPLPQVTAMPCWPPLAIQCEIWSVGGVGPARLAVMDRAPEPKTAILGRHENRPAATAFLAIDGDIAMLHAMEVRSDFRRKGIGRRTMQGAANWARIMGAQWMTLAVVRENTPANALYTSLGMAPNTAYHYRRAPEAKA